LSRHAIEVFRDLDVRRDPELTTAPEALAAMLEARRLPVYEGALELERLAGGAPIPPNKHLGVFAALSALEGNKPIGPERLPRVGGAVLLPVVPKGYPSLWIGEHGVLYLVDTEAAGIAPVFDSPVQYLEALAIELETEPWPQEPERPQWHYVGVDGLVGAELALALDAEPFPPATGDHGAAWLREHLHIVEQDAPSFFVETRVTTTDTDEAVAALKIALATRHEVRWGGPQRRPRAGQRPVLSFTSGMGRHASDREVAVWGEPGDYRIASRGVGEPWPFR
jgi:hypothetical protein